MAHGRSNLWVLIATHSFAEIYEIHGLGKEVHKIKEFENPDARKKASEIYSDRATRSYMSFTHDRRGANEVDPHGEDLKRFVIKIGEFLHTAKLEFHFERLGIIAPPQVLGQLRLKLADDVLKSIAKEVAKEIPQSLHENERINQMCEFLDLWNHAAPPRKIV